MRIALLVGVAHEGKPKARRSTKMATKNTPKKLQLKSGKKADKIQTLKGVRIEGGHPVA